MRRAVCPHLARVGRWLGAARLSRWQSTTWLERLLQDIGDMMGAGVDLVRCLELVAGRNPQALRFATALRAAALAGLPLSATMEENGAQAAAALVAVGEVTGNLGGAFVAAAAHMQRRREARRALVQALAYPLLLLSLSAVCVELVCVAVLPSFLRMSEALGGTQSGVLVAVNAFATVCAWTIPFALAAVAGCACALCAPSVRHNAIVKQWVARATFDASRLYAVRAQADAMGTLLAGGVDLVAALGHVCAGADEASEGEWTALRAAVLHGRSVAYGVARLWPWYPAAAEMMAICEERGDIAEGFARIRAHAQLRLTRLFARLGELVAPLITIGLGVVVGGATLLLVIPMMDLVGRLS
jgi:type IV pilus assembly protein PilC